MKKLFIILAAFSLFGCVDEPHHTESQKSQNYIHYYKDPRTDICFAGSCLGCREAVLTTVPCTPEVERLLESFPEYYGP